MDTRPIRKQNAKIKPEIVIIGRARNPRYDYRPRIRAAYEQGRIEWLEQIQQSLFNDLRYSPNADKSLIGMQIRLSQNYIDSLNEKKNMDNNNQFRSLFGDIHDSQVVVNNGGENTTIYKNYNGKEKEDGKPSFVDATEVKDEGHEDIVSTEERKVDGHKKPGRKPSADYAQVTCLADMIDQKYADNYKKLFEEELRPHLKTSSPSDDPMKVSDMEFNFVRDKTTAELSFSMEDLYKSFTTYCYYLKSGYTKGMLAQYMHDHITGLNIQVETIRKHLR